MESNQFIQQGKQRSAILASGKLFNEDDGLIWPIPKKFGRGRFFAPAGLRYVPLVVDQTTAGNMPSQQTRKIGQMTPYCLNRL
jgi:hypothetical protein